MPAADDLFAPRKGDTFARSRSGLAFSDSELAQMRAWIADGDQRLGAIVRSLGDCLVVAADAMAPVRPGLMPGEPYADEGLRRQQDAWLKLQRLMANAARMAEFPKAPFFARHSAPSGGNPDGLHPREFDDHRNDEEVFDKARELAIENAAAAKEARAAKKAQDDEAAAAKQREDEDRKQSEALMSEYLRELSPKPRRAFEARLKDPAFSTAAGSMIEACSCCVAAAAILDKGRLARFGKAARAAAGSDQDLIAMWRFYFKQARELVPLIVEDNGAPRGNIKKALSMLGQVDERIGGQGQALAKSAARAKPAAKKRAVG